MADKKKINFNINKNVLADLDTEVKKTGLTRTAIITTLITNYLYKKMKREVIKNEKYKIK